jgi:RNA polymerase primary sigma factor
LADVLERVRAALLPDGELSLFSSSPRYAVESERLAMAMREAEPGAFDEFVVLHRRLVRHASKRLLRWFGMDRADAQQTAVIGLIHAARKWEPERGLQFSTYAHYWLLQACYVYGPRWGAWFHVPAHWAAPGSRLARIHAELVAVHGPRRAEIHFDAELAREGFTRDQWFAYRASRTMDFLAARPRDDVAQLKVTGRADVVDEALRNEVREAVHRSIKGLTLRDAEVLRLRYGIGEPEQTLEMIGQKLKITRERVRQIQDRAEVRLHRLLLESHLFDEWEAKRVAEQEAQVEEPEETQTISEPVTV